MPCRQEARLPLRRLLFLSSWSKVLCSPRNFHDFTSLRSGLIQSDHIRKNRPTCSRRPVNSRATQSWTCESTAELAIRNRGIDRWIFRRKGSSFGKNFSGVSLRLPGPDHMIKLQDLRLQHPQLSTKRRNKRACNLRKVFVGIGGGRRSSQPQLEDAANGLQNIRPGRHLNRSERYLCVTLSFRASKFCWHFPTVATLLLPSQNIRPLLRAALGFQ